MVRSFAKFHFRITHSKSELFIPESKPIIQVLPSIFSKFTQKSKEIEILSGAK
jgi:hypothetical protein